MGEETQEKLSYEQLEQLANQLSQVNAKMREQLEKVNYGNFHQRMAYLFEVIKNKEAFGDYFVNKCVDEITYALTIPEEETKE